MKGTKRALLLERGVLTECDIPSDEISSYSHIALFNAMIDFQSWFWRLTGIRLFVFDTIYRIISCCPITVQAYCEQGDADSEDQRSRK